MASEVFLPSRKPNWSAERMLFDVRNCTSWKYTAFSRILEKVERSAMGLKLSSVVDEPFLGIGQMNEVLKQSGKVPSENDELIMCDKGLLMYDDIDLITVMGISSGPAEDLFSIILISFSISTALVGNKNIDLSTFNSLDIYLFGFCE